MGLGLQHSHDFFVVIDVIEILEIVLLLVTPVGTIFFAPVQTGPGAQPTPIQWVPSFFHGVKWRGVALITHPIYHRG
jgi:hypothetical protein